MSEQISKRILINIYIHMNKQTKYIIKFTNVKNQDGTVWYTIQVFNSKQDQSWTFRQRYSHMRDIHERCLLTPKKNDLPQFPHKKLFGNTKEDFIQKRKKQLQNYYNTLLSTVNIQQLPQLLQFFNTNKPKVTKQPIKKPIDTVPDHRLQANKEKILKKKLQEIVARAQSQMVVSNDFYDQIDDDTRKKFNNEFQKLKFDLKSSLLDGQNLPKGLQQNAGQYWAFTFKDHHQESFKTLERVCKQITLQQLIQKSGDFVVAI